MLGISGQWVFQINFNGKDLKLDPAELESFTIIEESGNLLPTWQITFNSSDTSLGKMWNESNPMVISLGKETQDMREIPVSISKPKTDTNGPIKVRYSAMGVFDALGYVSTPHVRTIGATDAITVMKSLAENYFQWDEDNNIEKSQDKQPYIQTNISDKKFMDHLAKHAFIPNSYLGIGITSDGRFKAVDAMKLFKGDAKWAIGPKAEAGPGIGLVQCSDPIFNSNSSLVNNLVGYGTETPMIDSQNGARIVHQCKPMIGLSQSSATPRSNQVERKSVPPVRLSTNHDVNYHLAETNNYTGLMNLSNECVTVSVECGYAPISVWDVVQFSCLTPGTDEADEVKSGKYVVGVVSRQITGGDTNRFVTKVKLFREAHNNIQGNLKS